MVRCKMIFIDKKVRYTAMIVLFTLLVFIFSEQVIVMHMIKDYKKAMMEHDSAIAGHLLQSGFDKSQIATAFTTDKTASDIEKGSILLYSSGYRESMNNGLLPEVKYFHQKYMQIMFAFSALISLFLLATLYHCLIRRYKQFETAELQLRRFLDGDISIRLDDGEEGSLSHFFTSVNTMATSLIAHIEIENLNKKFLKDIIADISHQLKTPLAALLMYNEIIQEEKTGNQVVESFICKSNRELERIEILIHNLLKLAKLDAGTIELEKKDYRLKDFLKKFLDSFNIRAGLEDKNISLKCSDSVVLCFDEIWLGEAIGNIIKNALDHTNADDQIEISCTETVIATEITIKDTGTGIHPEDIHNIFKRFYRSRYSKDRQGVGIGLALSKVIVEKHGGTITVQSELGQGAEFHLIFPKLSNL